jgi:transcriptional regulator
MYLPSLFRETDREKLIRVIKRHPFATLIATHDDGVLEIAHAPFLFDDAEPGTLLAHVARSNPIAPLATSGRPLVVVVGGPHGYVSASWYGAPRDQVPTWNYIAIHVHGRGAPLDRDELLGMLSRLSKEHDDAWGIEAMNPNIRDQLAGAIVGFRISIDRLEGKFKLSQNRSREDYERVVAALRARGSEDDREMVDWMIEGSRG